jgi:hypothetical protein
MPLEKVEELTDLTKYEPNRYSMFVFQHGSQAILSSNVYGGNHSGCQN